MTHLIEAFPKTLKPLISGGFFEIRLASDHRSILASVWSEVVSSGEEYEIILLDPPPKPESVTNDAGRRRGFPLFGGGQPKGFKVWFSESDKRANVNKHKH